MLLDKGLRLCCSHRRTY